MINSMASCALCILALLVNAVCASSGVFHNPPAAGPERDYSANPIYYVGDTISANWSTSIVNTSLFITQERTANIIPLFRTSPSQTCPFPPTREPQDSDPLIPNSRP